MALKPDYEMTDKVIRAAMLMATARPAMRVTGQGLGCTLNLQTEE